MAFQNRTRKQQLKESQEKSKELETLLKYSILMHGGNLPIPIDYKGYVKDSFFQVRLVEGKGQVYYLRRRGDNHEDPSAT